MDIFTSHRRRIARNPINMIVGLLSLVVALLAPVIAFAQTDPAAPAPTPEGLLVALISTVGAASVSLLTAGVKRLLPNIPRVILPTIVIPALGVFAAWVGGVASGDGFSVINGALITLGALYLRETLDTVKQHGADPIPDPDDPFRRR